MGNEGAVRERRRCGPAQVVGIAPGTVHGPVHQQGADIIEQQGGQGFIHAHAGAQESGNHAPGRAAQAGEEQHGRNAEVRGNGGRQLQHQKGPDEGPQVELARLAHGEQAQAGGHGSRHGAEQDGRGLDQGLGGGILVPERAQRTPAKAVPGAACPTTGRKSRTGKGRKKRFRPSRPSPAPAGPVKGGNHGRRRGWGTVAADGPCFRGRLRGHVSAPIINAPMTFRSASAWSTVRRIFPWNRTAIRWA